MLIVKLGFCGQEFRFGQPNTPISHKDLYKEIPHDHCKLPPERSEGQKQKEMWSWKQRSLAYVGRTSHSKAEFYSEMCVLFGRVVYESI